MPMDKREAQEQAREAYRIIGELLLYAAYCLAGDPHSAWSLLTALGGDIDNLRQKHVKEQIDN